MQPLSLSEAERTKLRDIDPAGYEVFNKVFSYEIDAASFALNNVTADHRYYQGKLHALYQLRQRLQEAAKPEPGKAEEPASPWPVSKPSATTDY